MLGDRPRRRDLLIEHLHLIQDRYHRLGAAHLAALAEEMRLAMAEVYEVASFYAHFDIVAEDEAGPPARTVRVCDSVTCSLFGGPRLLAELADRLEPDVRVIRAPCMGRCEHAPVALVERRSVDEATVASVVEVVASGAVEPVVLPYLGFEGYVAEGGYRLLRDCLEGRRDRDELIRLVEDSELRGLGGAGFRSGQKWRLVRQEPGPRLMAINADEGEPGTFKDRHYLERDPHRFLEGMLIAAWAVEAAEVYIYLRDEYPHIREILEAEIARLGREEWAGSVAIHLRRGAGAYICGEESAMLESIEGKRGLPRHKPPFPSQVGLFGRPTLIHNVETVFWIRDDRRARPRLAERAGPQWPPGPAQLLRLGTRQRAGREARAGGDHGPGIDRRVLRRDARRASAAGDISRAGPPAASSRPTWPTSRSTSGRSRITAASSARPRSSCSPTGTTCARSRST